MRVLNPGYSDTLSDDVQTELNYLTKEAKHKEEKPYEMRYDTGGVIPHTNMSSDLRTITIRNFRPLQDPRSFIEYGFRVANVDCSMTEAAFDDDEKVETQYYPAVEKLLQQMFPDAAEIRVLEHGVSQRDAQFNANSEELFETVQSATAVHIDYSPYSAARTARAFTTKLDEYKRLLTVNVWKSLQGPGNDWPLALCDSRIIDHKSDSIVADVVFTNRFTENERLYYNPKHEWYYFKDLEDDEVILLRQTDSALEGAGGVARVSIYNPKADPNAAARASVEVRAYVLFE
ncbi:hypothetical protein P152DRAFT_395338 [Eremomyces bilateralis CBS 781.70]|uniref:Methyltransferase n=1 Tax=Eremomyces bilateralis CBS 781.70 TaxID=1392243 RepID=A0A6G1G5N9_9PEZI|nr:uncharacterized protein P152DRAFT_395338 [Eremomyces bilateralis CBS 781.70]KAF1813256.1 hypothetical protein P152DRAFT_395338 [Eremomyces bilateralis CBS 781.70]